MLVACIVQKNAAHDRGGDGKEVGAVLPMRFVLIDEPEVSLVYQGRSLQCVVAVLATHVTVGKPV